ncbi:MAG: hypothetical protein N3F05_00155 [Candidatus Diapherotrites archaeon]|nr:hypothetical protein [Candidatus Diapherotrites archaeon]
MQVMKRIGVLSCAKVFAVMYALIYFIVGLFMALGFGLLGAAFGPSSSDAGGLLAGMGFLAVIIFPIIGLIGGFIAGAIIALIYNFVAGIVGGIEVELQ